MNRVTLLFPQLLLLIAPLLALYFWRARTSAIGGFVRIAIITLLVLLAAVPLAPLGGRGVDVIVVADLSRSMPADSRAGALEIVRLLDQRRSSGDRVGIVTFGRDARTERLPEEFGLAGAFVREVDGDGSDLGGAIGVAASLIPRGRPGRLIVLSDGEANGLPVAAAAQEASARGLPIDFRLFSRGEAADVAVESLDLPAVVDEREPFQFTAWVRTDRTVESEAVLLRDGVEVARTRRTFPPGATQLTFRDLIDRPGVSRYRLELAAAGDRVPENNRGDGAVRVDAPAAILVVNTTGQPDNLGRALAAGKMRVTTVTPAALPHDLAGFLAYRAVILENVAASAAGPQALGALARFANDLGGGLLVTGGGASFGVGGYFKSALDPYLPVSMEIKNEHRKLSLAMAVVLDRSGSMAMAAGDGRTKMDLANLGTCAAIDTLGPFDQVSVIAVDSEGDSDAAFLKDVAARGQGRMHFTSSAEELPRLFAQEAITVARSSFVTEPTATRTLPDMVLLGDLPASPFPGLDGYNLTYLRPGATMGAVTTDEYKAPVLAFWHRGLGRVASLTAEVDGQYSARLNAWRGFPDFAVGLGRWLLGGEPPSGIQASVERQGGQGIVRVELHPDRARGGAKDVRAAAATIVPPDDRPGAAPMRLTLAWVGEDTMEARFPVQKAGTYLGAVQLGNGTVLPLGPLSLPYSPEFEPRADPKEGEKTLVELARVTGGIERTGWDGVFDRSRLRNRQVRDLVIPLALGLLLLHVIEIAGRRLYLFAAASAWLRGVRWPKLRRAKRVLAPATVTTVAPPATTAPPLPPPKPATSPLSRAKAKARGRMGG